MSLFFMRHGETDANVQGWLAGAHQSQVTPAGVRQVLTAAQTLRDREAAIERIVASPRVRTLLTATIVAEVLGFDPARIERDERLRERHFGQFEGRPTDVVFSHSEAELVAGGMEPLPAVFARLADFYAEVRDYPGAVLVVGHNGSGRVLKAVMAGAPVGPIDHIAPIGRGSWEELVPASAPSLS